MNYNKFLLSLILVILGFSGFSQNGKTDSLWKVYNKSNSDTIKWNAISNIANEIVYNYPDSSIKLINSLLKSGKMKNTKREAICFNNLGNAYTVLGNEKLAIASFEKGIPLYEKYNDTTALAGSYVSIGRSYSEMSINNKAEEYFHKALDLSKGLKNSQLKAAIYNCFGVHYQRLSNFSKAIEYFFLELKECEKSNSARSGAVINIGNIYSDIKDYSKSLEYLNKGVILAKKEGNKSFLANSLYGIGSVYYYLKNYEKAEQYFKESSKIYDEIGYENGKANVNYAMAVIFKEQGHRYMEALDCFFKVKNIYKATLNPIGEAMTLGEIGNVYSSQHKYNDAISSLKNGLVIAREAKSIETISTLLESLYSTSKLKGDHVDALKYYEEHIIFKDSMFNDESKKTVMQNALKYEYDKQFIADSIKNIEEVKIQELKHTEIVKEQKMYASGGIIGFVLMLVVAGVSFRAFKIKQKSNLIITEQKHIVEEKHREITDSINYAERIQRSFLATKNLLDENLKDYFVYFQPKDVVSGDFYWGNKLSNGNFILVTADSTGHGVPGAIMSILNISSLEKAVDKNLSASAEILNHTRATIIDRLKKDGSSEGGKDGMDCSLICFDFRNQKISYSAANNPIWIIRNDELIELKPDKMPVGKSDKEQLSFTQNEFNVLKNDIIYTLTDGFPDQFGGEKGKKFMHKRLKEYLISISHYTMEEQNKKLEETFNNWMGENEQVDDVSIIGIRI